ncbi:MAG TPA: hypothetical protein VK963_01280 [Candidatus Saccharimonadales bacterium]|nr:hypothetical protein [Candidatus Saccharimonadales bacterium]
MSCQFHIDVRDHEIMVDSTVELCSGTGMSVMRPMNSEKLNREKLGESGLSLVNTIFIDGVIYADVAPYSLRIKVGKLFGTDDVHRVLENYIQGIWREADILGDRYEEAQANIGFVITLGPSREDILRVLDGNNPEYDPMGWEALIFKGHKPGSDLVETLVMRFGHLVGRRDNGESVIGGAYRPRPPQGERIVWDLFPCNGLSIGPEPTAEHLRRQFYHPNAQHVYRAFVRYNDVTGAGLVLDEED